VPPTLQPAPAPIDKQQVVASAINFLEDANEPEALLMLDGMHRRFGISEFADALQRYDQLLAQGPLEAPLMRLFRRIAVHDNPLQTSDLESVSFDVDQITIPALYCDQLGLPFAYPTQLIKAANYGEYMLTHALLAWTWIQENGYEVQLPEGFVENLYLANAKLVDDNPVVSDLELEAAAFLYLAGQGEHVEDVFIERVIAVQNYDGGWLLYSDEPSASDQHATVLALMLLLHVEHPAESYPSMLAPPSP
jgi:hypothetical protein